MGAIQSVPVSHQMQTTKITRRDIVDATAFGNINQASGHAKAMTAEAFGRLGSR